METGPGATMAPSQSEFEYDPFLPLDDPFPLYRRLRDEAPLYHNARHGLWVLSRFADVQAAARDHETYVSCFGGDLDDMGKLFEPGGELTGVDPPTHTRLRNAVRKDFSPKLVKANLEAQVRRTTRELIASLRASGQADLAGGLALPLPGSIVCAWLGFPEEDHPRLIEWFAGMSHRVRGASELPASAFAARDKMAEYIEAAVEQRRRHEQDDLITTIARENARGEIHDDEIVGMALLMFIAGIVTTSGLISTALWHLAQRPDDQRLLREDPGLIPNAVEEFLRYDAPLTAIARTSSREVELHGQVVPAGERFVLLWGSANRDERRWEDPDALDLTREHQRNLTFGEGIHFCLGAPLARMEGAIALEELLRATVGWELDGPAERHVAIFERGFTRVPLAIRWAG